MKILAFDSIYQKIKQSPAIGIGLMLLIGIVFFCWLELTNGLSVFVLILALIFGGYGWWLIKNKAYSLAATISGYFILTVLFDWVVRGGHRSLIAVLAFGLSYLLLLISNIEKPFKNIVPYALASALASAEGVYLLSYFIPVDPKYSGLLITMILWFFVEIKMLLGEDKLDKKALVGLAIVFAVLLIIFLINFTVRNTL